MDSRYVVDTLFDGDVAAARQTLREGYGGDNPTIRRLLEGPALTPDQVIQLLDGGDGVSSREAADLRRALVEARITRLPQELRAAALAHSGVEVHNHFKGVLEPDYFVKRLYGDDSDASYVRALDWLRGRYGEVGPDGQLTPNALELRAGSPEVLATLEGGYRLEDARQIFHRIMQAGDEMPFDATYDPRGELIKRVMREVPNGGEVMLRDTLARLRADGVTYAELQLDPRKVGVTPERFRQIALESGVQVELLTHLISERSLGAGETIGEAQLEALLRGGGDARLPRDLLAGFDVAGREAAAFTPQGMQTFENAYVVLTRAAGEEGQPYVLRPHVGEGYARTSDARREGVSRDGDEARIAQQNIQSIIDRVQDMRTRGVYVPPGEGGRVIIRLGHVTHATEAQARAMHDLGLIAEVNIGSNIATGALPRPRAGATRLSEHPLLLLLYHGVDVLQSTDAQGVMSTNMVREFALAESIISDFKSGRRNLEVDGRTLRWAALSPEERASLDQRLSLDRIREASLRYRDAISARRPPTEVPANPEGESP